jgi:hypothetical protein
MVRILSFVGSLLLAGSPLHCQTNEARVLVIGIDGLRSDCLEAANTPALDALIAEGIFSPDALNNDITYSGPGWSGMICGVWSDKHGVTGNNFVGSNFEAYPSFMRRLELENSALNTHSICHWAPINDYVLGVDVDDAVNVTSDVAVRDGAVAIFENGDPHAVFLHFDDVDINGHGFGFNANVTEYMNAIEATDQFISDVLVALTSRPNYANENWLVIVSTDHGGIGFNHGGTTIEEETTFFIASGDAVSPNVLVKDTLEILPAPENCIAPDAGELQFGGNGNAVVIDDHPSLQLGTDQDFTLEVRIRTEATPDVAIFGNKDWDSGLNPGVVFSFEYPNGPAWKVNIGDGNQRADANGSDGVADGQWHTLSCSFDRDGMMRLYTDGVFSAEEDISFIDDIDVGNGWYAGSDIFEAYSYMGAIAEIRFWQDILSEEVIGNWHCSALDATHPQWGSLQGHWALTEGAGSQANNSVSAELAGTIQGATWNEPQGVIAFDYSNTPRVVDVAATALDHMCLTIDPSWNLDGISWVDGCNSSDVERLGRNSIKTNLFPNPGTDAFQITGLSSDASIEIFDPRGQSIHFAGPGTDAHSIPQASGRGVYLIRIVDGEERRTLRWVRQ